MFNTSSDVPQNTTPHTLPAGFDNLRAELAAQIKRARSSQCISQEGLALTAQIDRTYLSQIERHVANPSLLVLMRIAETLRAELTVALHPRGESESHQSDYAKGLSDAFDIVEEVLEVKAENWKLLQKIKSRLQQELGLTKDEET